MILNYAQKVYDRMCLQTQCRNCENAVALLGFCSGIFVPMLNSLLDCKVYGSCRS